MMFNPVPLTWKNHYSLIPNKCTSLTKPRFPGSVFYWGVGVGAIRHPTVGFCKRWEQRGTFTIVVGIMVGEWDQTGRYLGLILGYWDILEGFGVDGEGSKLIKSHILGGYEHQITRHFGGEQKGTGVWNLHSKLLLLQIFFSASSNIAINTRLKNIYIQLPWCQPT